MIAICLSCNNVFRSGSAFVHPSHSCLSDASRPSRDELVVDGTGTTASTSPSGAVVLPFRRPARRRATGTPA